MTQRRDLLTPGPVARSWTAARPRRAACAFALLAVLAVLTVPTTVLAAPAGTRVAVTSTSWSSADHGWVLGTRSCPAGHCATVARTTDAGAHWAAVSPPGARLAPSGGQGVDEVRFADDRNGWAFGPQLHVTHDGGAHWRTLAVPGGGRQVVALEAGGAVAYAVVSSCVVGAPASCPRPGTLWRAPVGSDAWQRVPLTLPAQGTPRLTVSGTTAYVVAVDPSTGAQLLTVSTGGGHWTARHSPCDARTGEVLQVAPASVSAVALLCSTDVQPGTYTKRVFWSTDAARTSTYRGSAPVNDTPVGVAAEGRTVAIAGAGGDSRILTSADRGRSWQIPYEAASAGLADLTLVGSTGALVRGPSSFPGGVGQLLLSHDGGRHWAVAAVSVG